MADGLARQIAGLTGDIRNLGKRIPSYQRGVVANVSPPTVIMDRDVTATPRPVADVLVPGLAVGQRVEVRVIGSRRVITSIHPADSETYFETSDGDFWAVAGGISTAESRAIRDRNVVTIYLRLNNVTLSAGTQNVALGTIKEGWRPSNYFMPWQGWANSGHLASGLISSSTGALSVRWASGVGSGLILTATYPAEPWPA